MKTLICLLTIAIAATAGQQTAQEYLTEANRQFTTRLSNEVARQHPGESIVLSGLSLMLVLGIMLDASTGTTHDEILKTIGLPKNMTKEIFSSSQANLKSVKGITLNIANKIYVGKNSELNDKFTAVTRDVFDTEIQNIDFNESKKAADEINSWVENHTEHRIKDLVDPSSLSGATAVVLVNALYFKGSWKYPFIKDKTTPRDFYVNKDKKVQVQMMYKNGDCLYGESKELDAKLVELPYEGDEVSFVVILPNQIDGLPELYRKLSEKSALQEAISSMRTSEVEVFLPKFEIETETNLVEALKNMHLTTLFSPKAELTNLLKGGNNVYVTDAKQKTTIIVDEEGTEAASANDMGIDNYIGYVGNIFLADRPFYFGIKIIKSQEYVFSGDFTGN